MGQALKTYITAKLLGAWEAKRKHDEKRIVELNEERTRILQEIGRQLIDDGTQEVNFGVSTYGKDSNLDVKLEFKLTSAMRKRVCEVDARIEKVPVHRSYNVDSDRRSEKNKIAARVELSLAEAELKGGGTLKDAERIIAALIKELEY